jgi:hypothetical protein
VPRTLTSHRIIFRAIGIPALRALVLPLIVVLLSVGMADATVDWTALRGRIDSVAPWQSAALLTALVGAWCFIAGRTLRGLWHRPFVAFLVRQPLSRWQWVVYLGPSLGIGLLPVAGIWWLAPGGANELVHYLGFVALAWPIMLGAACAGVAALVLWLAATLTFYVLVWLYSYTPIAAYGALLLAIAEMSVSAAPIRRQVALINRSVYSPLSGSGVIMTIIRRDLRYLFRTQRTKLAGMPLWALACSLLMLAFRVNGGQEGREALLSAGILVSFSVSPLYEILETLKVGLGREIMRRRWPVSHAQRTWALLGLIALLVAPSAIPIGLFGATMGAANVLVYLLFVGTVVTLSAALFSRLLVTRTSANGLFLLLITGHAVSLIALPGWTYALLALACTPAGLSLAARGLSKFTSVAERTSLDELA